MYIIDEYTLFLFYTILKKLYFIRILFYKKVNKIYLKCFFCEFKLTYNIKRDNISTRILIV